MVALSEATYGVGCYSMPKPRRAMGIYKECPQPRETPHQTTQKPQHAKFQQAKATPCTKTSCGLWPRRGKG